MKTTESQNTDNVSQPKEEIKDSGKDTKGEKRDGATTMCVNTKNAVLLETAKATVYRPDIPHRKQTARIILDARSQRSYIIERATKETNLVTSHTESLTIKPFGSSSGTTQVCDVSISVDGDNDVTLSAISVPLISAPVQGQYMNRAVKNYSHLANLQLADDCEGDVPIDLLVGADQY